MVNMGNCMRCCCLSVPISWTISSFILVIWILVGSTTTAPFPADTYFIRFNVSNIDPAGVTPLPGYTIAETLGLHDFYQTGLWNYCEGYYRLDADWAAVVTACGPQANNYYFDPIAIMSTELMAPYSIVFTQPEVNAIDKVHSSASWLRAAFVITALFTGFTLVIGPLTGVWHERKLLNCIPVGLMGIAAFFWFIGAITATNVYITLRNAFNNDARLHVEAHLGHQMFAWVWLGVWVSTSAAWLWCCAAICCPGGHRKRRVGNVKVFSWLPAIPWLGSPVDSHSAQVSQSAMVHSDGIPVAPMVAGLGLADHFAHQEQQMQPQQSSPGEHHGHMGQLLAGTALLAAGAEALHHHNQQQQQQPQSPPPQQHHALQHGLEAAAGVAALGALAEHQHQQQQQPAPQHHQLQHGLEAAAGVAALGALAAHQHQQHQQQQDQVTATQQQPAMAAHHQHQYMQLAEGAAAGAVVGAAGEAILNQHQQPIPLPQPGIPIGPTQQASGGEFAVGANIAVAEGAAGAAGGFAATAGMQLGQAPVGLPPNVRPSSVSGRPPSQPPPPPVIVPQPPGVQPLLQPLPIPVPAGPGGLPMVQGGGPLMQGPPPGAGVIPPNGQPILLEAVPAVAVPAGPSGAVRPDGSLQNVFPYGPSENMVAGDVNALFGRESHR